MEREERGRGKEGGEQEKEGVTEKEEGEGREGGERSERGREGWRERGERGRG